MGKNMALCPVVLREKSAISIHVPKRDCLRSSIAFLSPRPNCILGRTYDWSMNKILICFFLFFVEFLMPLKTVRKTFTFFGMTVLTKLLAEKGLFFLCLFNCLSWYTGRPLALRGHLTNASFKQCVGILLMPKMTEHKNILHPKLRGNAFKGDILWHFDFSTN